MGEVVKKPHVRVEPPAAPFSNAYHFCRAVQRKLIAIEKQWLGLNTKLIFQAQLSPSPSGLKRQQPRRCDLEICRAFPSS